MTRSWSEMARTALDGGRIWRGLVKRQGVAEADLRFRSTDMIVISLLRDIAQAEVIVCPHEPLRVLIQATLDERAQEAKEAGRDARPPAPADACLPASDGRGFVMLTPVSDVDDGHTREAGCLAQIVYGVAALLPARRASVALRLLSSTAPALWQCGLALVVTEGNAGAMRVLVEELALSMRGDWIDPLMLYERVQVLTAKVKAGGEVDEREPEGSRIFELERELATLKRAALVNQHLMLVDAAERVRKPT